MRYKVSVIIPSYKPKAYIYDCLNSMTRQTLSYKDYEVIVILNGCCEPWKTQLRNYFDVHTEVNWNFISTLTPGVSNARNMGLDAAKGEYITFIDDDDYVADVYLEHLITLATPHLLPICHPKSFDDTSGDFSKYDIEEIYKRNPKGQNIPFTKVRKFFSGPCMKLIHRDIIGSHRFDTSFRNGEDSLFMFLISDKLNNIIFADEETIYYRRIRSDSAEYSKKPFAYVCKNSFRMIGCYCKYYARHPRHYRLGFFVTRILGSLHTIVSEIKI